MRTTEKMTVSLPKDLIVLADKVAKEKKISRSKVVSQCLEELARKRKEELMKQGYSATAREHDEFARAAAGIAYETLPEWKA
jgi:metal-responsive CopG/Arc/MetJ family transcriptional regulator